MDLERVVFGSFIILALALNLGFVTGDADNPVHHSPWHPDLGAKIRKAL